jgi:hypothetical protein
MVLACIQCCNCPYAPHLRETFGEPCNAGSHPNATQGDICFLKA